MPDPDDNTLRLRHRPRMMAEDKALQARSRASAQDRRPVALDQQSVGRLSRMDAMQQQAMAAAQEARRAARHRALDAALQRLEAGEFGYCNDCGDVIGFRRLEPDTLPVRCVSRAA